MFNSTIFPLKKSSQLIESSAKGEFDDPEMILTTSQANFLQYRRRSSKSLIISPFTLTQAFSQDSITLLPTNSEGAGGSPLLPTWHPANSLGSTNSATTLDFISALPTEISVQVLLYLQPQDLCNASGVSSRWYQLTQCGTLHQKRNNYLQQKREEYQKSKENCPHPMTTPPHPMSQQTPATFTKAPSPLGNIQPASPQHQHHHHHQSPRSQPLSPITWDSRRSHTSSPTLFPSWDSRSHTSSPTQLGAPPINALNPLYPQSQPTSPSPRSHTSSPTLLVDDVNRLSLEDCQDIVICRPLSPDLLSTDRGGGRSLHLALRQVCKEVAGRKLNKNRLRRL